MSERTEIEYNLTVLVEDASNNIRKLERLLFRTLGLLQRLGLPPEADALIDKLQQIISIVRQVQITINLFYAASGPIGWALFGVSLAATALSYSDFLVDLEGH